MNELSGLAALIGAIAGAGGTLWGARWANRKAAAETAKIESATGSEAQHALAATVAALAESSRAEIEAVREEIERVRRERDGLQHDVDRLTRHVDDLAEIMRRNGIEVPPMPPREAPPPIRRRKAS